MVLDGLVAGFRAFYDIVALVYMLLACEHYIRTNHAWLHRYLRPNSAARRRTK